MKRFAAVLLGTGIVFTALAPAYASNSHSAVAAPSKTVLKTFHLNLSSTPDKGATFWVAYGPLNGRFGIVRLRSSDPTTFSASLRLLALGRTTFAYIEGHGSLHTPSGPAPGNPVSTIKVFDRVPVTGALPTVYYSLPQG